jgi:membrane associated rhomboid family serine protease
MGLYDRDYMRSGEVVYRRPRSAPWSPTIALLVVLVIIFLFQNLMPIRAYRWFEQTFALSLEGIKQGYLWQFLTFQFLHGGFLHILLNGVALYSLGRFMEQVIGRGRFLALYFLSGIAGGALQTLVTLLLDHKDIPVVGASAGIAGLLGAFALMYPHQRLTILLFVFPVNVRAAVLLWSFIGLSVFGVIAPFGRIAHAAHLGGILAGLAYVRFSLRRPPSGPRFYDGSAPPFISTTTSPPPPSSPADFIASEVDPILEKIATQGIHSLTERERRVLDEARKRMGHR